MEQFQPRQICVGERQIQRPQEIGFAANIAGVDIYTDDTELSSSLCCVGSLQSEGILSLTYITGGDLTRVGIEELLPMSSSSMGDVYVTKDLRNFAFAGFKKFGTLASLAYGIRSFHNIQFGLLGIHSAAILDKKTNLAHLIIGRNKAGKSTLAAMLAGQQDRRFQILSDDWVEIYSDNTSVTPISVTLSTDIVTTEEAIFVSFGKAFIPNRPTIKYVKLGGIVELLPNPDTNEHDEQQVKKVLGHIPFIDMPLINSPEKNIFELVMQRRSWILSDYLNLRTTVRSKKIVNQNGVTQLDYVMKEILNFITSI